LRGHPSRTVTSPYRPNRHEVTGPFRVLPGSEVAGLSGYPLPVRRQRSRKRTAHPVFLHPPAPKDATPWAILSWGSVPLHGLSQSLRPRPLDRRHLSWGLRPLQRSKEERVHVRPVARFGHPGVTGGLHQQVPPCQLRCRSQVFSTSQRLLPLSSALPFSGRWHSWGSALQGFVPSTQPRRLVAVGIPS
jgi:hypothetical protein